MRVVGLSAAKEATDRPLGALIVTAMTGQMIDLNRGEDALELIHGAQYGGWDAASPRQPCLQYAMEG
ncbi:hypothetical protein VM98_34455, partial [Streptomyces rubellomurinus subsp. indigoferus]